MGLIHFLYKRPLDTLLATWGLSLAIQQVFRSAIGPKEVSPALPEWLMGSWAPATGWTFPGSTACSCWASRCWSPAAFSCPLQEPLGPAGARHGEQPHHGQRHRHQHQQDRPPDLRHRLRHRWCGGAAFTTIGSTGPTSGSLYIVDAFLVVTLAPPACWAPWHQPSASRRRSPSEFFISGSMAKVLTLSLIVVILMIRPQACSPARCAADPALNSGTGP